MYGLPLYKSLFSRMWFVLPFNDFEFGTLTHLGISPSHGPKELVYVKVFKHWCEYKNNIILADKFQPKRYKIGSTKGHSEVGLTRRRAKSAGLTKGEVCQSRKYPLTMVGINRGKLNVRSYQQTWEICPTHVIS